LRGGPYQIYDYRCHGRRMEHACRFGLQCLMYIYASNSDSSARIVLCRRSFRASNKLPGFGTESSLFLNLRCLIVVFAHNFFRVISSEYTAFTDVSMAFRNRPSMQDMPVELVPSDFEVWVLVRVFVYRFEQFAIPRTSRSLACGGGDGLTGQGVGYASRVFLRYLISRSYCWSSNTTEPANKKILSL